MMTHTEYRLGELLRHLDSQRGCALMLIEKHTLLLASMLGQRTTFPVPAAKTLSALTRPMPAPSATSLPKPVAQEKGKVISLFAYTKPVAPAETKTAVPSPTNYLVFKECDVEAMRQWKNDIDSLLATHGADDALAVNRKHMADTVFLSATKKGLFYFKSQSGVLFAISYVGADEHYAETLRELKAYGAENGMQVNLMAQEVRVKDLKDNGFSTTPMGIWQRIDPLSAFSLEGQAMRRLRYLVTKYQKNGRCRTAEYVPGATPDTDKAICQVIDQWVELKGKTPSFVADVKEKIMQGGFGKEHRFFLTYRDDAIDNVMVFSRDNFNNGYLMDLEFYAKGIPLGSTEFALTEIIEYFKKEDRQVVSLGLTMGTELFEHENGSKDVHTLFEQLKKADFLNGDANAQYKNKYRPSTTTIYLARPHDSGKSKLNDLMLLLGSA